MITFADIVAQAKRSTGMTAAELDYSLACGDDSLGSAMAALSNAIYTLANEGLPVIDESSTDADLALRNANSVALAEAVAQEWDARIAAAKARKYAGWSEQSRGPIRYA